MNTGVVDKRASSVWIIDDDPALLDAFAAILAEEGFAIRSFTQTETLKEALRDECPQLLFVDAHMPGMTSLADLIKAAKASVAPRQLPVVVLSGSDSLANLSQQAGADAYLEKPTSFEQIMTTINTVTAR